MLFTTNYSLLVLQRRYSSCGVVWCGVVWCGVVWCGVVWCGVVWCGMVWCGVVWCGVVWCGVVWCGVVWCGVVWCGVVWCGVVWCVVCTVQYCEIRFWYLFNDVINSQIFFKERAKYDAPSTEESLENYDLNKPQIGMRKSSLKRFIVRSVLFW